MKQLYIIFSLIIFSCQSNTEKLIGDPWLKSNAYGFNFGELGSPLEKAENPYSSLQFFNNGEVIINGNKGKYKVMEDSLFIFENDNRRGFLITNLEENSLIIGNKNQSEQTHLFLTFER